MFNPSVWAWPQWTIFIYILFCLGVGIAQHGKTSKTSPRGFFIGVGVAIAKLVVLTIGGFFAKIAWPQIVWIALKAIAWGCYIAMLPQEKNKETKRSFWSTLISIVIDFSLYMFGGFFA